MTPTLPAYSIRALVNFLVYRGMSREALLHFLQTDESSLNNSQGTYTTRQYESVMALGRDELGIANVGFQHGKMFDIGFWGILGYIVAAAPTLKDALGYQQRYQCLLGNSGLAYFEQDENTITMRWLSEYGASANTTEQVITAWLAFAFTHTRSEARPNGVYFTHSLEGQLSDYEAFFRCPVHFNSDFNGVRVSSPLFDLPICTSNAEVLNVLCHHAEQALHEQQRSRPLDIIRQFVIEQLPNNVPDLTHIASYLKLSERQLQRLFQRYNTNCTAFCDKVRLDLAVAYLTQTEHKLLYISAALGYSEQSAFQRAFKRRYGVTPREFRLSPPSADAFYAEVEGKSGTDVDLSK